MSGSETAPASLEAGQKGEGTLGTTTDLDSLAEGIKGLQRRLTRLWFSRRKRPLGGVALEIVLWRSRLSRARAANPEAQAVEGLEKVLGDCERYVASMYMLDRALPGRGARGRELMSERLSTYMLDRERHTLYRKASQRVAGRRRGSGKL